MKFAKLKFPIEEMLMWSMLMLCGVVISGMLILSSRYLQQAQLKTDSVNLLRSYQESYWACEDLAEFASLTHGIIDDDQVSITDGDYVILVSQQEDGNVVKATLTVYYDGEQINTSTIVKYVGGNEQ